MNCDKNSGLSICKYNARTGIFRHLAGVRIVTSALSKEDSRKELSKDESCKEYCRAAADRDNKEVSVDPGNDEADSQSCRAGPHVVRDCDDRGKCHDGKCHIGDIKQERPDETVGDRLSEEQKRKKADHIDSRAHDQQRYIYIIAHGLNLIDCYSLLEQ